MEIKGEYWIIDGRADFADGDIGDKNHEMIAIEHVCSKYLDDIYQYAKQIGIENLPSLSSLEDEPVESTQSILNLVFRKLFATGINGRPKYTSNNQIYLEIERGCGVNGEALQVILQSNNSDPRLYVMKNEGWIAIRNNNIELYGIDQNKLKELSSGLDDIIDQETGWAGEDEVEINDENIDFNLFDHKTNKSIDLTLKDIKEKSVFRPQRLPQTTYNRPLPALTGKQYGRELWRGTSESFSFKSFLKSTEASV
jgi:hypothetical protein